MDGFGKWALLLAVACAVAGPVSAASPEDDRAFRQVLGDSVELQHVIETAGESPVMRNNPCREAKLAVNGEVAVFLPPAFDAQGGITAGAWRQSVRATGCGADRLLNVFVAVKSPGALGTGVMLPGTSHADPRMQKAGLQEALQAAARVDGACKTGFVADTRFGHTEGPARDGLSLAPWSEVWTVQQCKRRLAVPVTFTPERTGIKVAVGAATAAP